MFPLTSLNIFFNTFLLIIVNLKRLISIFNVRIFEDTRLIPKPKNFLQDMTTMRYREGTPINL